MWSSASDLNSHVGFSLFQEGQWAFAMWRVRGLDLLQGMGFLLSGGLLPGQRQLG